MERVNVDVAQLRKNLEIGESGDVIVLIARDGSSVRLTRRGDDFATIGYTPPPAPPIEEPPAVEEPTLVEEPTP